MALDLYTESFKDCIHHHEEYIIQLAQESDDFPLLSKLFSEFYDNPKVHYELCMKVAHELLKLSQTLENDANAIKTCSRLALFFLNSYLNKESITSLSD